ncbi:MAG TPA: hypothetical protein VMC06_14745 [Opitutaceae bacterium]|nr:hypothetical protein [Opitutaceae bacterium]
MKITRGQILRRGLTHRCPNCGEKTLFKSGAWFELNPACPNCGLIIERDEGFFLGSMSLNYGATVVGFITPVVVLAFLHVIGFTTALTVAAGARWWSRLSSIGPRAAGGSPITTCFFPTICRPINANWAPVRIKIRDFSSQRAPSST